MRVCRGSEALERAVVGKRTLRSSAGRARGLAPVAEFAPGAPQPVILSPPCPPEQVSFSLI